MGKVKITQERYEELLLDSFEYKNLLKIIFKAMELTWRQEDLMVRNDDKIIDYLKTICPTRVDATYRRLKLEYEMKQAAENESDAEQDKTPKAQHEANIEDSIEMVEEEEDES